MGPGGRRLDTTGGAEVGVVMAVQLCSSLLVFTSVSRRLSVRLRGSGREPGSQHDRIIREPHNKSPSHDQVASHRREPHNKSPSYDQAASHRHSSSPLSLPVALPRSPLVPYGPVE